MRWLAVIAVTAACGASDSAPSATSAPGSPVTHPPVSGTLAFGLPLGAQPRWSPDGKFVAFTALVRDNPVDAPITHTSHVVVDVATRAMLVRERVTQFELTNDRLITVEGGTLVVHDLKTFAPIGSPSPIAGAAKLVDTKLVWAARAGDAYRIHVRDLVSGAETTHAELPPTPSDKFVLDLVDNLVIGWTRGAIRIWEVAGGEPIVAIDDAVDHVRLASDGLTYLRREGKGFRLVHVDLKTRKPVAFVRDAQCGTGTADQDYAMCTSGRYLVRANGYFCVWDVVRGRLQTKFKPVGDEYHCKGDVAWAREDLTYGDYAFFSSVTGQLLHKGPGKEEIMPGPVDLPQPENAPRAGAERARATLSAGELLWRSPAPSDAVAFAFTPKHDLVVAGRTGELWRVSLSSRELTTTTIPECTLAATDLIAVAPDGRIVSPCKRGNTHALMLEGVTTPLHTGKHFEGWDPRTATTSRSATFAWVTRGNDRRDAWLLSAKAWSLPDGKPLWAHDITNLGALAVTADGSRFATGEPISIRDATNKQLRATSLTGEALAFSPDGAYLAIGTKTRIAIVDTATGAILDTVNTPAKAVAWEPSGLPRLAYWRPEPPALMIREIRTQRDLDSRRLDSHEPVHAVGWSFDGKRFAVLAGAHVVLWEGDAEPSTFSFAGTVGVELRADNRAILLGDPKAARELVSCTRDHRASVDAAGCEANFIPFTRSP